MFFNERNLNWQYDTNESHESRKLRTIFAAFILDPVFKLTSFLFHLLSLFLIKISKLCASWVEAMFCSVLNQHESHERHAIKTRQNNEAIAEVDDASTDFSPLPPLPMLPALSRKEVEILAYHPGHPHTRLVWMSLICARNFLWAFGFLSKIRIVYLTSPFIMVIVLKGLR